jgi:hypothetical protein
VRKGRGAVTHTDEHQANHTPVRNQFQELSEHQEDPTPSLEALKALIQDHSEVLKGPRVVPHIM